MGLFKKKQQPVITEAKCPAEGCTFTYSDQITLKKHMNWKHPGLASNILKAK